MLTIFRRSLFVKFIIFVFAMKTYFVVINLNKNNFNNKNNSINKNHKLEDKKNKTIKINNEFILQEHPFIEPEKLRPDHETNISMDLKKQVSGLGANGVAVELTGPAKERGERKLKQISLNEELSEQLSYNRILSDARNPICTDSKVTYELNILPTTSVIIIYYNEPYSVVIRTVHSVLRTTNTRILMEIILVDDGSTNDELKRKLPYYMETRFPKIVKLITLRQRAGIVSARLAGARLASGDILMFMDAHCECNIKWLEPLAARIRESRTSVVVPILDSINAFNFGYDKRGNKIFQIGGFNWNGDFRWIGIPGKEIVRINSECSAQTEICPTHSPTMSGGIFAIDQKYFWEIGGYDQQMTGWGGENLEMSFRIWQCGGTIETIPCSRIGHIFRKFQSYRFPEDKDTRDINTLRMAKVWMDEYINLFFMIRPDLKNNMVSVADGITLRQKLKCKNFTWYLDNVYPQKFVPTRNVKAYGHIRSNNSCLDDLRQNETFLVGVCNCHEELSSYSQFFSLKHNGILRRENICATAVEISKIYYIKMIPCKSNFYDEVWIYKKNRLLNLNTGLCLDSDGTNSLLNLNTGSCVDSGEVQNKHFVVLKECNEKKDTQKWFIEH